MWDSGCVESDQTAQIEYRGTRLKSYQPLWWKVRSWSASSELPAAWSTNASFAMGLLEARDWDDVLWIGPAGYERTLPCPMFRSPLLTLSNRIERASLYVSAKGIFELWLNGRRVGANELAPEWTDYRKCIQYQAFDVTTNLFSGSASSANLLGGIVGEGWFSDKNSFPELGQAAPYGQPCPQLAVKLHIVNRDGSTLDFSTSKEWTCSTNGPIRHASIYGGELYDARAEGAGTNWTWADSPVFSFTNPLTASNVVAGQMVWQPSQPVRVTRRLTPVDGWSTTNENGQAVTVYDFGQNLVGWCALRLRNLQGLSGSRIVLRHAERLQLDRDNLETHHGTIDVHNLDYSLGKAEQRDEYVLSDAGGQEFHPHFTYHGFRYVELQRPAELAGSNVHLSACVLRSSVPETGQFACSDPRVTRLMENIRWSIRGNLYGVMTDAPQRAEREGYLGSEMVISQTSCFLFDLSAFYTKWIRDIREAQDPGGGYPIYAPWNGNRYALWDPGWQVGGIVFPWQLYLNYGDTRMLAEHYASATNWMNYLAHACPAPGYVWASLTQPRPPLGGNNISYGDWLNGDSFHQYPARWSSAGHPATLTNLAAYGTAWAVYSADVLAAMSKALEARAKAEGRQVEAEFYAGRQAEFAERGAKLRQGFTNEVHGFVTHNQVGDLESVDDNCQAACVMALSFNLVPENQRARLARTLVYGPNGVENYNTNYSPTCTNHLSTGNQFTGRAMLELSREGYTWKAYQVLTNGDFPSWLYWVGNGATTCWERWNSFLAGPGPGRGYADYNQPRQYNQRMSFNSFNSLPFGAVGEWIWEVIGGINPDPQSPGFKHIVFWPQAGGGINWASAAFQTIHGLVRCAWTNDPVATNASLRVTVPPNTTASLYLPVPALEAVSEQGVRAAAVSGVLGSYPTNLPNWKGPATVLNVGSGSYCFLVSNATFLVQASPKPGVGKTVGAIAHNRNWGFRAWLGASAVLLAISLRLWSRGGRPCARPPP
jgi:alpha-L-rhamnosidase